MVTMLSGAVDPATGKPPSVGDFTKLYGPWIVVATVILPAIVAAVLNWMQARGEYVLRADDPAVTAGERAADHAYSALILPLAELVRRIGWGVIIVLGLILSYRITDNIWGSFAFPFYLQELQYTGDEVAFASKIFGVFMTMAGIAIGAFLFATIGRMPTLLIGALVAAASNLLYADLAAGAANIDAFARTFGLDAFGQDLRMVRLLIAISGENIAGGLAGAAFVAYLSSITSREFSAVQYALLSSLTFLVGSLGRAAIGEAIDNIGYAPVFRFTARSASSRSPSSCSNGSAWPGRIGARALVLCRHPTRLAQPKATPPSRAAGRSVEGFTGEIERAGDQARLRQARRALVQRTAAFAAEARRQLCGIVMLMVGDRHEGEATERAAQARRRSQPHPCWRGCRERCASDHRSSSKAASARAASTLCAPSTQVVAGCR